MKPLKRNSGNRENPDYTDLAACRTFDNVVRYSHHTATTGTLP
ncbi:hypothetical protein [Vreelandella andesensis]|nr:hypothetical protein [Halomonas andesensis]